MESPLDGFKQIRVHLGLPRQVDASFAPIYQPVAAWIAGRRAASERSVLIGINGAQGSGKSTFCELLKPVLEKEHHLRVEILSIDDVYHTRETRLRLAAQVHPLCSIRGVPGTHDIDLATRVIHQLKTVDDGTSIAIPRFDKAKDDRVPETDWDLARGPVDVILFEGWCVGCPPLAIWDAPYNEREAREDPDGIWAQWSISSLESQYRQLFESIDGLLMIKVPSMRTVRDSRWLQEKKLRDKLDGAAHSGDQHIGLMTREQVFDYVALFERATEHMFDTLPSEVDVLIERDEHFCYRLTHLT